MQWTLVAFLPFLMMVLSCQQASTDEGFATTYRATALKKSELPTVVADHPRLYIRSEPWSHGPSLVELKQWAQVPPLKTYLGRDAWDRKPWLEWAFRYMVTGDEALVPPIVAKMKAEKGYWPGYLQTLATIYDWLYNSPNFSAEDKRLIEDKLVSWGRAAIRKGEQYQDMWSHFGYGPVTDLAAAGLALHGHRKEAEEFLSLAGGYLKKNLLPGWQLNEGAWQGGWAYYSQGPAKLMTLIHLWSAGTDDNLYQVIAKEQGDGLRKHLYFLLSSSYGKSGPLETGGFSYSPFIKGMSDVVLPITYAYQDANGIAALESLKKIPWQAGIWQFIFYSPVMHAKQVEERTMPLSQLWGREGVGYAQMRSGWGDGETLIDFKCGDYFWSHQFHNQNAFTIYRGGALAVQSGIYDAYWGPHMQYYYRPTVGSNSMLVIQPGETSWIPPGAGKKNGVTNDGGWIPEFGGQRTCFMHPDHGSAENCFSLEKYLYRKDHQHHFETGTMQAWEVGQDYTYASGDATMAYNNPQFTYPGNTPKLDHASRDLVFLDQNYLLVFDRVNSLDPAYEKRWLLHTIGAPQVAMQTTGEEVPGHITTYPAGRVRIDNGDGTLFVETIFPEESTLRVVGGTSLLTTVQSDPANQGDAQMETDVRGQYAAMGGTIATDAAQAEKWTIEFISDKKFKVNGSRTGADGEGHIDKLFFSRSYALLISKGQWRGTPKKGDKFHFETTSSSYRFWVDGQSYLPNVKKMYGVLKDGSKVHPGNWRLEVSPVAKSTYNSFLHLLTPTDRKGAQAPESTGIRSGDGRLTGLHVQDWVVMFAERGGLKGKTSYAVAGSDKTRHLLLGLDRDTAYAVELLRENRTVIEKRDLRSSPEGTLQFSVDSPAAVVIAPGM
jgi:hypothetical protein